MPENKDSSVEKLNGNPILGEKVRAIMNSYNWSQKFLAQQLNWPETSLSSILTGKSDITLNRLLQLSLVLGVEPEALIKEAAKEPNRNYMLLQEEEKALIFTLRCFGRDGLAMANKLMEAFDIARNRGAVYFKESVKRDAVYLKEEE